MTDLERAVRVLCDALRTDPGYRESWKANIAMMFKDEVARSPKASVHEQANAAADNFLTLICYRATATPEPAKPCCLCPDNHYPECPRSADSNTPSLPREEA